MGVGGPPSLVGEVELDASIMDGATRRAGTIAAVARVAGFPHPISIALTVCDLPPQHVMLVGAGAERFADEAGIARGVTLTEEARQMWQDGLTFSGLAAAGARHVQCLCLTPDARHGGASTNAGATSAVITAADAGYRVLERRRA